MATAIILGIYIMEVIKYCLALAIVYQEKIQKRWSYYAGTAAILIYMLCTGGAAYRDYVIEYAVIILATIFAVSGNFKDRIIKSFLLCILIMSIDEIVAAPLLQIEMSLENVANIHYWINLFTSMWGLAVLGIAFFFYKRKKEASLLNKNKIIFVIVMGGVSLGLTISSLNIAKNSMESMSFRHFADFVVSTAYISLCLLCWLLIYFRNQHEQKTREIELEKMLMEEQENYYQMLLQKEENTRKFRHDIENHLLCLDELANREDLTGLKKYLQDMSGQMKKIRNMLYITGDNLFDLILNDKLSHLEKKTKIIVNGKFCQKLNISEMDVCIIFSNLIQNAVEEINQQEEGWFKLQVQPGKQYTEVVIQNSAGNEVMLQRNGLPRTIKDDKKSHGLGLQNVKSAIERNGGFFKIVSKRDSFEVKIQLYNDR